MRRPTGPWCHFRWKRRFPVPPRSQSFWCNTAAPAVRRVPSMRCVSNYVARCFGFSVRPFRSVRRFRSLDGATHEFKCEFIFKGAAGPYLSTFRGGLVEIAIRDVGTVLRSSTGRRFSLCFSHLYSLWFVTHICLIYLAK